MGAEEFVKKDLKTMDAWEVIKQAADAMGIILNKPNQSCKKCHGRGYLGRHSSTGEPVPCPCIFPKETYDRDIGDVPHKPANRAERRKLNRGK